MELLKSNFFLWNSKTWLVAMKPFLEQAVSRTACRLMLGLVETFTRCPLGQRTVRLDIVVSENFIKNQI